MYYDKQMGEGWSVYRVLFKNLEMLGDRPMLENNTDVDFREVR